MPIEIVFISNSNHKHVIFVFHKHDIFKYTKTSVIMSLYIGPSCDEEVTQYSRNHSK